MSETFHVTPEDNLSPDGSKERVRGVASAQLIADAVKPYEDESAALRNLTEFAMKRPHYALEKDSKINFADMDSELDNGEPTLQAPRLIQDQKEALEVIGQFPQTHVEGLTAAVPVDAVVEQIKHNNEASDNIAETIGDAYDKLESTKR